MNLPYVLASSCLTVILVLALVREIRTRQGLQQLLARILTLWRTRNAQDSSTPAPPRPPDQSPRL